MRTTEEYRTILALREQNLTQEAIASHIGTPRSTVRDCILRHKSLSEFERYLENHPSELDILRNLKSPANPPHESIRDAYLYLLGMYLGDGYINREPRTYRLRISLDMAYPQIIQACADAVAALLPSNKVGIVQNKGNWVSVSCYSNHWPDFFPQHGAGSKHKRQIRLKPWQQRIAVEHPKPLLRGLIHSDGSRSSNKIGGTDYPRYSFKNHSEDILQIFSLACDRLGVHWTTASSGRSIQIARRADVAFLDQFIGPKS
jgi:hypothetical protein